MILTKLMEDQDTKGQRRDEKSRKRRKMRVVGRSVRLLQQIIMRSSELLNLNVEPEGSMELARRSRGTPRVANRLLRRIRDFAEQGAHDTITLEVVVDSLERLGVDRYGLESMHRQLLRVIVEKFEGGPVGLSTLAAALSETKDTIEEVFEPYLIQEGFMARTPRGRVATRRAYQHFNLMPQTKSRDMFEIAEGNDGLSDLG
ncbi:MAG: hypothetical protein IIC18_08460 [Bacteroidetes bacterium]|nr:hypothetical protein [Bacteroidota bacterium]